MDNAYLGVDYGGSGLSEAIASWNLTSHDASSTEVAQELAETENHIKVNSYLR